MGTLRGLGTPGGDSAERPVPSQPADCRALIEKLKGCSDEQLVTELQQIKTWNIGKVGGAPKTWEGGPQNLGRASKTWGGSSRIMGVSPGIFHNLSG